MEKIVFCSSYPGESASNIRSREYIEFQMLINGPTPDQKLSLEEMDSPTAPEFVTKLSILNPSILHFCGGSQNAQQGISMWKEKEGEVVILDEEKWGVIFGELRNMLSSLNIIVLSVFSSAQIAKEISIHDIHCIAFTEVFDSSLKIAFCYGFYYSLTYGKSIEDAFSIGISSATSISEDTSFKKKVALYYKGQEKKI